MTTRVLGSQVDSSDTGAIDLPASILVTSATPSSLPTNTFSFFKEGPNGTLTDDDAFALAVRVLGPSHRTLIIDAGTTINLTRTIYIPYGMSIVGVADRNGVKPTITTSSASGGFSVSASDAVSFQGLSVTDSAGSGTIIQMYGRNSTVLDCDFSNTSSNKSTMVTINGYDQLLRNCSFVNNDSEAYCWSAVSDGTWRGFDGSNINEGVSGGSASGIGNGGLISNTGSPSGFGPEGFSVENWTCTTAGTQIKANDVYSFSLLNCNLSDSAGTAVTIGEGESLRGALGIYLYGNTISSSATAIDITPLPGAAGANYLTINNNVIVSGASGINVGQNVGRLSVTNNTFSTGLAPINFGHSASSAIIVNNIFMSTGVVESPDLGGNGRIYIGNITPYSPETSAVFNVLPDVIQDSAVDQDVQSVALNVLQPDTTDLSPAATIVARTFSSFKFQADGSVLSDDQAMALAISTLGAQHGTLIIDDNVSINLSQTVIISHSMTIQSESGSEDAASTIRMIGSGPIFSVVGSAPVVFAGLSLQGGATGSMIQTGSGATVIRNCALANDASNDNTMVVLQGGGQLLQDDYFTNNSADAFCWATDYGSVNDSTPYTAVDGGWAYGSGQGGLIGADGTGAVSGFSIDNWKVVLHGAHSIEADNVGVLNISGGIYDYSSSSAFALGYGSTGCDTVALHSAFVSTASNPTSGIGIDAGGPGGVRHLDLESNQLNSTGTAIHIGQSVASATLVANDLAVSAVGIVIDDGHSAVTASANQVTANLSLSVGPAIGGSAQASFIGNAFEGKVSVPAFDQTPLTFTDNLSTSPLLDAHGVPLQGNSIRMNMTAEAIQGLPGALLATLTNSELRSLTPLQISYLTSTQIQTLSISQIQSLTPSQIGSLSSAALSVLSPGCIAAIAPAAFADVSSTQMAALDAAQLGAINAVQLNNLPTSSLSLLTASQVAGISPTALGGANLLAATEIRQNYSAELTSNQVEALLSARIIPPVTPPPPRVSSLFDASFYLQQNPDVAKAGVDAYKHYVQYGWKEGRNPSPLFNTNFYLTENPQLRAGNLDPLSYFEADGWKNGTDPSAGFSVSAYLQRYGDVAAAGVDPLLHYVQFGRLEGRVVDAGQSPDPLINANYIRSQLSDESSVQNMAAVYNDSGWQAGMNPDPVFDTNYYLEMNPDVKAAGCNPLLHYEEYGWKEGRDPSAAFSTRGYLTSNPDVSAAGVDPLDHYINFGWNEGRSPIAVTASGQVDFLVDTAFYDAQLGFTIVPKDGFSPQQATSSFDTTGWERGLNPDQLFDTKYYLTHNPDVAAAHMNPLTHYELFGWKEGRDPSINFSTNGYLAAHPDVQAAGVNPLIQYISEGQSHGYQLIPAG